MVWITFIAINALNLTGLINPIHTHAAFNIADTICKYICNVVISEHNEIGIHFRENMDMQGVNFVSHLLASIKKFETNNLKTTPNCRTLIQYCKKQLVDKIPKTNSRLKLELLNKILPFDLDHDYVTVNSYGKGVNRQFDFICVMFMDIVNYTELANRYSGDIVFKLLDKIYNHFDNIIKKYPLLQKIETIGDAYMVVGDIYREKLNHKDVVKSMILLGLDFIKEIKTIETPDGSNLCIRLGINLGPVNIGILGNEIPRLCVVGNTVNVAARLQSCADPDSIQMSTHVYEQVQEIDFGREIVIETKEKVFLKNIGVKVTYIIHR
jgi:class 3 adenylate cyclase